MTKVNAQQGNRKQPDSLEARRQAWMEQYREERREEGRAEGRAEGREERLRDLRLLLGDLAAHRFGSQTGQRLVNALADTDDQARFLQVGYMILDSADGGELLSSLYAES